MQSLQERKETKNKTDLLNAYGVTLGEITPGHQAGRFFSCLVRAILIFMAVAGTVLCSVTPFGISFNIGVVLVAILIMSLYVSFLYYNRITFYVGYICMFFLFTIGAVLLYWYVNSGFQALSNIISAAYSDYFNLSSYLEASEYIANRYLTITVALAFLGGVLCIFMNIAISGSMNLVLTFLFSFPFIQIPLYIELMPSPIFSAMLLSVYITVGILHRSSHFRIPPYTQKKRAFIHVYQKHRKKQIHNYISSGNSVLTTTLLSVVFSSLFLLVTNGLFYSDLGSSTESNVVKNATDDFLKVFSQTGIRGFLNRYESTGGLARGRLGGVSAVRPDYQLDLSITFVPTTLDAVYLKSYVGDTYTSDAFIETLPDKYVPIPYADINAAPGSAMGWMEINAIDPQVGTDYRPYNTYFCQMNTPNYTRNYVYSYEGIHEITTQGAKTYLDDFPLHDNLAKNCLELPDRVADDTKTSYSLYSPLIYTGTYEDNPAITKDYEAYVYSNYLDVPSDLEDTLHAISEEAGLSGVDSTATPEQRRQQVIKNARTLYAFFVQNYDYTMAPGTTPRNRDVVEYFLTDQRRGYCMHYAASSAMILRSIGIPTRYVEGYMIKPSDLADADAVSETYDAWLDCSDSLPDTGLVNVRITDGNAHAWTEIYLDGYGWIPFEFTPPSSDDETVLSDFSFFSMLGGLFRTTENAMDAIAGAENTGTTGSKGISGLRFVRSMSFLLKPLVWVLLFAATLSAVMLNYGRVKLFVLANKAAKGGNYSIALRYKLKALKEKLLRKKQLTRDAGIREILVFMQETPANKSKNAGLLSAEDANTLQTTLEKALFGKMPITSDAYQEALTILRSWK